jgi:hypothetical protein
MNEVADKSPQVTLVSEVLLYAAVFNKRLDQDGRLN